MSMHKDYHIFAEPLEKTSTKPVSVSTESRSRAIWFLGLMHTSEAWKRVWVEHEGKSYTVETMGELP